MSDVLLTFLDNYVESVWTMYETWFVIYTWV